MNTIFDFYQFDQQVRVCASCFLAYDGAQHPSRARSAIHVGYHHAQVSTSAGPACAAVLRETTAKIEAEQKAGVNVRALFGAPDHLSDGDFYCAYGYPSARMPPTLSAHTLLHTVHSTGAHACAVVKRWVLASDTQPSPRCHRTRRHGR